jgi:hypothetical protein
VNHFVTSLLLALFSSIILGVVTKDTHRERIRYGATCFGWFMVALFGIGWFMRLLHG